MKTNRYGFQVMQPLILISIINGENGEVVEEYKRDIGDLDPFELKRLLQNVCNRILSQYRRELLIGYAQASRVSPNQSPEPVPIRVRAQAF